jgi:hypothetical protein
MPFRLRMPAEIGAWLAELAGTQPEAAAEAGAALLALMRSDVMPGPPLVTHPDAAGPADPRELLDDQYQRLLAELQPVRRELAEAGFERERTARLLQAAEAGSPLHAQLARRLDAARQLEAALQRRGRLLQQHVDAFRIHKETAKALVTVEEARVRIQEALQAAGQGEDPGRAMMDQDLAASDSAARFERAQAEAFRLLGRGRDQAPDRPADVLELRPDPMGSDARMLLAEEPAGTVTVLVVLDDAAAVAEHRAAALDLAGELLAEIRAGGWPADGVDFADGDGFLTRFFPARGPDLARRAAGLSRATSLARLREQAGLTPAELAERGGPSGDMTGTIDRRGLLDADVGDVAAYARALGGTLRLTVDLDGTEHSIG